MPKLLALCVICALITRDCVLTDRLAPRWCLSKSPSSMYYIQKARNEPLFRVATLKTLPHSPAAGYQYQYPAEHCSAIMFFSGVAIFGTGIFVPSESKTEHTTYTSHCTHVTAKYRWERRNGSLCVCLFVCSQIIYCQYKMFKKNLVKLSRFYVKST